MLSFPCFAKKRISLEGNWGVTKSIISKQPIQAWLEDNNKGLLLEFSVNLGTIEVTRYVFTTDYYSIFYR